MKGLEIMVLEKELYTVQEVAQIINKSVQAVYLRLDNLSKDGKEYATTGTDGKKRVKREFITDFYGDSLDQIEQSRQARHDIMELISELAALTSRIEEQEKTIEQLRAELEAERIRSARLEERTENQKARIKEQSERITNLIADKAAADSERRIYSAALISNNKVIADIKTLSLSQRLFGWSGVQQMLTDSINNTIDTETAVDIPYTETDIKE